MRRPETVYASQLSARLVAIAITATLVACAGSESDASPRPDSTGDERLAVQQAEDAPQASVSPPPSPNASPTPEPPPSPNVPIPERLACSVDRDCVLTTFLHCCSHPACDEDAAAVARAWLAEAQEPCAVVECQGSGERAPCIREGTAPSAVACVLGRCQISAY